MLEIEQIYEKYFDSIFSYVLKRVNNVETAEDITSTVFMKVLRSLKHYKAEKASVKTWIYAITGNEVINFYRKKKISLGLDKYSHLLKSADVLVEIQEKQNEFEKKAALSEALKVMDEQLTVEEKDILMAVYFDKISYRDLAEITGIKEATLRSKVHRSLKKIKKKIDTGELL